MIIPVNIKDKGYDIVLERGVLSKIGEYLDLNRKVLIVTDDGVPSAYAEEVAKHCSFSKIVVLPQGEKSKNFDNYKNLLKIMLENSFTRKDCVVAVGGGVIGDLSGFVASSYMRGVDFYNVPTTLLSQVDSSIGGKVAIDFENVKNVIGAFYQPKKVIIDPSVLDTLPERQIKNGLVESIKMSLTSNAELFAFIEENLYESCALDKIIEGSLLIKKSVVEQDPEEKGLRMVLNFGHTLGHGIEGVYMDSFLHGECVALGMLAMCSKEVKARLKNLLTRLGMKTSIDADVDAVKEFLTHDKKAFSGGVTAVFVEKAGTFDFRKVTVSELTARMEEIL